MFCNAQTGHRNPEVVESKLLGYFVCNPYQFIYSLDVDERKVTEIKGNEQIADIRLRKIGQFMGPETLRLMICIYGKVAHSFW